MATAMKKCKVCGKEYEYCHTAMRNAGVFRFQDVACSPEHGAIYLAQVEAARSGKEVVAYDAEVAEAKSDEIVDIYDIEDEEDDEYDELFESDFDDDDDAEETALEK